MHFTSRTGRLAYTTLYTLIFFRNKHCRVGHRCKASTQVCMSQPGRVWKGGWSVILGIAWKISALQQGQNFRVRMSWWSAQQSLRDRARGEQVALHVQLYGSAFLFSYSPAFLPKQGARERARLKKIRIYAWTWEELIESLRLEKTTRSSSPTINPLPSCPLSHGFQWHTSMVLQHPQGDSDSTTSLSSLFQYITTLKERC